MTRPTKKRSKRPGRRTAKVTSKRETSDRVSRIAGKALRIFAGHVGGYTFTFGAESVTAKDIRALAASCLNQDERRGNRSALVQKPKRRGKAG